MINFLSKQNYKQLNSSALIRYNDKHMFTFSPIMDILDFYKTEISGIYYKEQECFRNVFPANLDNPLSLPLQKLIGIYSFSRINNLSIVKQIYIILPDIKGIKEFFIKNLSNMQNNFIFINSNRLRCNLPIDGDHYYIKISYHYNNGLVTLGNFVLVDWQKDNSYKLDSVFFSERINFVSENKNFIFESSKYSEIYHIILNYFQQNRQLSHFFLGNILGVLRIIDENLTKLFYEQYGISYDILNKKLAKYNGKYKVHELTKIIKRNYAYFFNLDENIYLNPSIDYK